MGQESVSKGAFKWKTNHLPPLTRKSSTASLKAGPDRPVAANDRGHPFCGVLPLLPRANHQPRPGFRSSCGPSAGGVLIRTRERNRSLDPGVWLGAPFMVCLFLWQSPSMPDASHFGELRLLIEELWCDLSRFERSSRCGVFRSCALPLRRGCPPRMTGKTV